MRYLNDHYYHVYNRGAHKKKIFFDEENYLYLISLFKKYSSQYNVNIVAYCLMPNHYHLILQQKDGSKIGNFLKTTFNAYTQAINKRYGHSGTLFQGQCKSKHIDSDEYCLQVIRYVHHNPLSAHLVFSLREWQFSNYLEWIGARQGILADFELRNSFFKTPLEYEKFVEEYNAKVERAKIEKFLPDQGTLSRL